MVHLLQPLIPAIGACISDKVRAVTPIPKTATISIRRMESNVFIHHTRPVASSIN